MSRRRLMLTAAIGALALAGCGGSGKPATTAASNPVTTSQTTATSPSAARASTTTSTTTTIPAAGAKKPVKRKAQAAVRAPAHSKAATTASAASATTSRTRTTAAAATPKPQPKPKSPVACMVRAGLQHVAPALQVGTWQGTDGASHRPIFVDGPYPSAAAASQSVSTLRGVNQAAAGGVWEVSASLRGGTGPAVRRVAACLANKSGSYSF